MAEAQLRIAQTKQDLNKFIMFPFELYRNDPYWVPPLIRERKVFVDRSKNPFFKHAEAEFFLAEQDGAVVGTIAAVINHAHNRVHEDKIGFWGMFEVIDDYSTAEMLFAAARDWVKARGMDTIRGPMNLSVNDECGLLVDGFDSAPVVMMTYNPRYYEGFVERFGFGKTMDLFAYALDFKQYVDGKPFPEKLVRVADKARKRAGVTFRKANLKEFDAEIKRAGQVYNAAWARNWGAIPMTEEEFYHLANGLKLFLDADLIYFVEKDGKPVGLSLTLPDLNQPLLHMGGRLFPLGWAKMLYYSRRISAIRVLIMGVLPEFRSLGLDSALYAETARAAIGKGITLCEMSWILESNTMMRRIIEGLGGAIYKTYRVYDLALDEVSRLPKS
jgi:GNAT superfamily N-acetyltransferase